MLQSVAGVVPARVVEALNPVLTESTGVINNTRGSGGVDCVLSAVMQRFSATFVAQGGKKEEDRVLNEFQKRLADVKFVF